MNGLMSMKTSEILTHEHVSGRTAEPISFLLTPQQIVWWVDACYGVHHDLKSHTGAIMSLGRGLSISVVETKDKHEEFD